MTVKVLVRVDRKAALKAILALDALGEALVAQEGHWPKKLKRKYKEARQELVTAIHHLAFCTNLAETPTLPD